MFLIRFETKCLGIYGALLRRKCRIYYYVDVVRGEVKDDKTEKTCDENIVRVHLYIFLENFLSMETNGKIYTTCLMFFLWISTVSRAEKP